MSGPTISGNYRGFAFFKKETDADSAKRSLEFWQRFARQHEETDRVHKRVKESVISPTAGSFLREMEYYYANKIPKEWDRFNFEYLRLLYNSTGQSVKLVHPQVLELSVIFDVRISLTVNPFFRFLNQFRSFVGVLDDFWLHYNMNGALLGDMRSAPPGVREMERMAVSWMEGLTHNDTVLEDVFVLLLDRYNQIGRKPKKEPFFEKVVSGIHLSKEIRRRAISHIMRAETLYKLRHKYPELEEFIVAQLKRLPQFISSTESRREEILSRRPALDINMLADVLEPHYGQLGRRIVQKLARMIIRARRNTFSKRTRAPPGYIGVIGVTEKQGNNYILRVIPGQDPYQELPVMCNRDMKLIYPVGSLFIVWLPLKVTGEERYYRSYNNVAHHIDFPLLLNQGAEEAEEMEGEETEGKEGEKLEGELSQDIFD